jgi:transposase InsO family protein
LVHADTPADERLSTDMSKPRWRRRLAMILDRDSTQPLPIYTYLIEHDERLLLLDWFNNRCLHSLLDYVPPEEYATASYAQLRASQPAMSQL